MGYLVDEQELIGYKGFTNSGHEPFEVISFEAVAPSGSIIVSLLVES